MDTAVTSTAPQREFPCIQCGAKLVFAPGTTVLACQHCGTENPIPVADEPVYENDYAAALSQLAAGEAVSEALAVKCSSCGAQTALPPNVTADKCPFCGAPIVAEASSQRLIRPGYLLPFKVTVNQAMQLFQSWIASRWFAPSALRQNAEAGRLSGIYMPAWTYDCTTDSTYTGQRGDDYWVTETHTQMVNGKAQVRTHQVRKTRWRSVSGRVRVGFDNLLVRASESLPEEYFHTLEPWDLDNLVEYRDEYLAGFSCESYQVSLPAGFEHAREDMQNPIRASICGDIGGDHQRIDSVSTRYFDITFKHILLPLWISAYHYHERSFRFMVNARTGEVHGERPYSAWKIVLSILGAAALIAAVVLICNLSR